MSPPALLGMPPPAAMPERSYAAGPAGCERSGRRADAGSGGSPAAGRVPGAPRGGATAIRRITGGEKAPEAGPKLCAPSAPVPCTPAPVSCAPARSTGRASSPRLGTVTCEVGPPASAVRPGAEKPARYVRRIGASQETVAPGVAPAPAAARDATDPPVEERDTIGPAAEERDTTVVCGLSIVDRRAPRRAPDTAAASTPGAAMAGAAATAERAAHPDALVRGTSPAVVERLAPSAAVRRTTPVIPPATKAAGAGAAETVWARCASSSPRVERCTAGCAVASFGSAVAAVPAAAECGDPALCAGCAAGVDSARAAGASADAAERAAARRPAVLRPEPTSRAAAPAGAGEAPPGAGTAAVVSAGAVPVGLLAAGGLVGTAAKPAAASGAAAVREGVELCRRTDDVPSVSTLCNGAERIEASAVDAVAAVGAPAGAARRDAALGPAAGATGLKPSCVAPATRRRTTGASNDGAGTGRGIARRSIEPACAGAGAGEPSGCGTGCCDTARVAARRNGVPADVIGAAATGGELVTAVASSVAAAPRADSASAATAPAAAPAAGAARGLRRSVGGA